MPSFFPTRFFRTHPTVCYDENLFLPLFFLRESNLPPGSPDVRSQASTTCFFFGQGAFYFQLLLPAPLLWWRSSLQVLAGVPPSVDLRRRGFRRSRHTLLPFPTLHATSSLAELNPFLPCLFLISCILPRRKDGALVSDSGRPGRPFPRKPLVFQAPRSIPVETPTSRLFPLLSFLQTCLCRHRFYFADMKDPSSVFSSFS